MSDAIQVPQTQRRKYGIGTMEVLATNNPSDSCLFDPAKATSTYPEAKRVFTVSNLDFAHLYETQIHDALVTIVKSSLPAASQWVLNVLRLGFDQNKMANPIVVHLLIARGCVSDEGALSLVKDIEGLIFAAQWEGEKIYVDVCQGIPGLFELRSAHVPHDAFNCIDLSQRFPQFYSYVPALPGFSIGPKDSPNCTGSFSGFIKHTNATNGTTEIFGLTCEHVLNGSEDQVLGSSEAYRYNGGKKFMVTIPSSCDHEATLSEVTDRLKGLRGHIARILNEQAQYPGRSAARLSKEYESSAFFAEHWATLVQQAQTYNTEVGHVYGTSGQDKSRTFYDGRLDWGIFCSEVSHAENKHARYSPFNEFSSFLLGVEARPLVASRLGESFLEKSKAYLDNGPTFKPVREAMPVPDEIFFKVASRSSGWREAEFNGIRATICDGSGTETREWCFVTSSSVGQVSRPGDSGAPIIDSNLQPTAIVWAGEKGGQGGIKDVTYATPICEILKDIERRMGWEKGSVTFC